MKEILIKVRKNIGLIFVWLPWKHIDILCWEYLEAVITTV